MGERGPGWVLVRRVRPISALLPPGQLAKVIDRQTEKIRALISLSERKRGHRFLKSHRVRY